MPFLAATLEVFSAQIADNMDKEIELKRALLSVSSLSHGNSEVYSTRTIPAYRTATAIMAQRVSQAEQYCNVGEYSKE